MCSNHTTLDDGPSDEASLNYRSVVVLGRHPDVDDPAEKGVALRAFVEHVVPERAAAIRGADRKELAATRCWRRPRAGR
jgi:nitroimidazol reductase NimA-like FMN-containing flavoprotein (pyridoxamine 5'-phosphate oxidase superfamily)